MNSTPGNDVILGHLPGRGLPLTLPRGCRDKHLYVCGSTGMGKSKFLESLIRQDIVNWTDSRCGLLLLDPHGTLYDSTIDWLAWNQIDAPVVPIDLRQDEWVISYNLLRQRQTADPAVLVDNLTDAMAYVWGQGGTTQTPLFARWAGNVIRALYENDLTLVEAEHLVDHMAKRLRRAITSELDDSPSRQDWRFADTLTPKDFESQIGSTVNRLRRFVVNQTMRRMFGLGKVSLDLGQALEQGSIVLVNLATSRGKISKDNSELFATLLLSDLWTAAQERGKYDGVKPFYVYIDEFQRFISPTISDNLDEARGFGLHLTMAHQFPNQLKDRGENGRRVYNSIMENASSKVVFRLSHQENLEAMAQWLYMGVMDPDMVKHELYSTKVLDYREETRTSYSRSQTGSKGGGTFTGVTGTESFSGRMDGTTVEDPDSWNRSTANSEGDSSTWTEANAEGSTESSILIPVFGKELSHVQFRSLEEQLFRAMAVLFDQRERHSIARLVGMSAPVSLRTPTIDPIPPSELRQEYLGKRYAELPFALPLAQAQKQLDERKISVVEEILNQADREPKTTRQRVR